MANISAFKILTKHFKKFDFYVIFTGFLQMSTLSDFIALFGTIKINLQNMNFSYAIFTMVITNILVL